jgi:hypothetical protein
MFSDGDDGLAAEVLLGLTVDVVTGRVSALAVVVVVLGVTYRLVDP